ncbi:unnamed protein product [Arabidopsis halleri]
MSNIVIGLTCTSSSNGTSNRTSIWTNYNRLGSCLSSSNLNSLLASKIGNCCLKRVDEMTGNLRRWYTKEAISLSYSFPSGYCSMVSRSRVLSQRFVVGVENSLCLGVHNHRSRLVMRRERKNHSLRLDVSSLR